jgi:hypothetical protein
MILCLVVGVSVPAVSARATRVGPALVGSDWAATAASLRGHNGSRFLFVCPAGGTTGRLWGTGTYTDDSSVCTAAAQTGTINVTVGGSVTIEIRKGRAAYIGSRRHGVTSSSYGAWSGSFVIIGGHRGGSGGAKMGGGGWAATAAAYTAHSGARYTYVCPPGGPAARVWGTDMYTDDSSVCTAAVQVGLITVAHGGTVTIQMAPGMPSYLGYTRNGVTTRMYGHWRASFHFPGMPMILPRDPRTPIGGMSWSASATSFRGQNGARYLYACPPSGSAASVWGTDTYTDDSSVCTAAVHKGLLGFTHGGYLTIQIVPGMASYVGSTRNGVTTKSYGRWVGSFTFLGTRAGSFR